MEPKVDDSMADQTPAIMEQIESLIGNAEYSRARDLLAQLVESQPDQPYFAWRLGSVLGDYLGRWAESIPFFRLAIDRDPRCASAWAGLGLAYVELGEWQSAVRALRERLALKETPSTYILLAIALREEGDLEASKESCLKALALAPRNEEAHLNLGLVLRRQRRFDEAIEAFEKAIALDPDYAAALRELGWTLLQSHDRAGAKRLIERSIRLRDDKTAHLYLAEIHREEFEYDLADEEFRRAIELARYDKKYCDKYSKFLFETGNYSKYHEFINKRDKEKGA
jgi:protein O-GlcNAc transferase